MATDNCPFQIASKLLKIIFPSLPSLFFDHEGDRCYCIQCHTKRKEGLIFSRGKPRKRYALPIGWVRFGLKIDKAKCLINNVWDEWHVAFHGTQKHIIPKIFKSGLSLAKSGDIVIGGDALNIRKGHIKKPFQRYNKFTKTHELFDPKQIYISPSIKYSGHNVYASYFKCKHPDDNTRDIKVQFAFQVRIRPGSYGIGQETVGSTAKGIKLDEHFSNDELEWYTKENAGIVLYGLLIRINDVSKPAKIFHDDEKDMEIISPYKIIDQLKKENLQLQQDNILLKQYRETNKRNSKLISTLIASTLNRYIISTLNNDQSTKNGIIDIMKLIGDAHGAATVVREVKCCINKSLHNCFYTNESVNNIPQTIHSLLRLHKKFVQLLKDFESPKHLFSNNKMLYAFGDFRVNGNSIAEEMAQFTHEMFTQNVIGEYFMQNVAELYTYIFDKDIFRLRYQEYLALRLLDHTLTNTKTEQKMIQFFQKICDYSDDIHNIQFGKGESDILSDWISKLNNMLKDIETSNQMMLEFDKQFLFNGVQCDLNVSVCNTYVWPINKVKRDKKPFDVLDVTERFTQFYLNKYNNRQLDFEMTKGTAYICVEFNAKCEATLMVSTHQMLILLLFNDKTIWTFEEMINATYIPRNHLINAVLSMAHPKVKVLIKTPNIKHIENDHKFQINSNSSNKYVSIPTMHFRIVEKDDKIMQRLYRTRRHQMDAAIVRVMKVKKALKHSDLASEVVKQLRGKFVPKAVDMKKRITSLIELEYIEVDKNDKLLYHYKI